MPAEEIFWNASVEELKRGYVFDEHNERFICIVCNEFFQKGVIYPSEGVLYEAELAVKNHVKEDHGSMFEYLLSMNKKYTGLTELQKEILSHFKSGLSDKEIVNELGSGSTSTIRTHRFKLKEKEKQAKVFLTIMELLNDKDENREFGQKHEDKEEQLINIHRGATMVDERYAITNQEREKVLKTYFKEGLDGPLSQFPSKEKRKIIILQHILKSFDPDKVYTEKEVSEKLKAMFHDFVTIRRYLIEYGFMLRNRDCSQYWVNT
ncbi:DUF2087 domain-containing protein [Pseudalkalibacillus caeni]|uniref:DUF2087 domain-containing protein n=1 Tax=Exobacillus caeni TaxID=2574798 RepID=A0A5R9F010_9BACL|nr:DUF2087 domain-containing protein [Pseudalkalibacillus caeni]TLS36837.1 DUF2087 domain-containing protein [Pseudalkalibacillus caeni]